MFKMEFVQWFFILNIVAYAHKNIVVGQPGGTWPHPDLPVALTPSPDCPEPFITCSDGSCISSQWVCDGETDCPLGEDENEDSCAGITISPLAEKKYPESVPRHSRSPSENHEGASDNSTSVDSNTENGFQMDAKSSSEPNQEMEKGNRSKKKAGEVYATFQEDAFNLIQETFESLNKNGDPFSDDELVTEVRPHESNSSKEKRHLPEQDSTHRHLPDRSVEASELGPNIENPSMKPSCCSIEPDMPPQRELRYPFLRVDSAPHPRPLPPPVAQKGAVPDANHIGQLTRITEELISISKTLKTRLTNVGHHHSSFPKEVISKLSCPSGFQSLSESCIYVQVYPPVSWSKATAECHSRGGQLLTLPSIAYYEKLIEQLQHEKQHIYSFWLGATNKQGKWTWQDKTPFKILAIWGVTLKKNSKNMSLSTNLPNQCAFLDGFLHSYVNGASCLEEKGFICSVQSHKLNLNE